MKLTILGRETKLSLAELQAVAGHDAVTLFTADTALVDTDTLAIDHLGGAIKTATVHQELPTTSWADIKSWMLDEAPSTELFAPLKQASRKHTIGISVYGKSSDASPGAIRKLAFTLKRTLRNLPSSPSVRVVTGDKQALTSATVLHNSLHEQDAGTEIIVAIGKGKTVIAATDGVQNIDAYRLRDHERPKRDPRVGMLPPKLAQIMINLAVHRSEVSTPKPAVVDPFCGVGTVLQEALLMGYDAFGSDIDPRMIDFTEANLAYLRQKFDIKHTEQTQVADATTTRLPESPIVIASEIDLGTALTRRPSRDQLRTLQNTADALLTGFLKNAAGQIPSGTRLSLAVPAWNYGETFISPPAVDLISDIGYNHVRFSGIRSTELIYHRPGQFVGRRLLVLERK